jgi:hypothetical protein
MGFITPDVAIIDCIGAVKLKWQKKSPKKRQSINTIILVKPDGKWKIRAFHNCHIQNPNPLRNLLSFLRHNEIGSGHVSGLSPMNEALLQQARW